MVSAVPCFSVLCCAFSGSGAHAWHKHMPGARQLEALGEKGRRLGANVSDRVEPATSKLQVTLESLLCIY